MQKSLELSPENAPPARKQPRIAHNVLSNWGAFAFGVVVNFFLSPFVVHHLGNTAFGVWVLIVSLTSYLGFMDLGVRNATTRFVAKFHAQGDHGSASRTVSSALAIFSSSGALAIVLAILAALFAVPFFKIPADFQSVARIAFFLGGLNIAAWLVNGVFSGVIVGLQRFDLLNKAGVAIGALRAVVVVIALGSGGGLITLALIELASILTRCLTSVWWTYRLYPELRLRLSFGGRQYVGMIFSFSLFSFLLDVATDLIYYSDAVVIGAFLPVAMITFFSIAANMRNYARGLVAGLANTLTPAASKLDAEARHDKLQQLLLGGVRYASLIMLPIALTFILRGKTFIGLWMGQEYADPSGHVLWILSLALVFSACNQSAQAVVLGVSKHKLVVPAVVAEGLANLGLSIALVRTMGIVGVAWAAAIPSIAVSLLFWPLYLRRYLDVPVRDYVLAAWLRPGLAVLPFALASLAIERFWLAPSLFFFFLQVGLVLPLAAGGMWFFCLSTSERSDYSARIRNNLPLAFRRT